MYAYTFSRFVYPEKRPYCLRHERELKRSIRIGAEENLLRAEVISMTGAEVIYLRTN